MSTARPPDDTGAVTARGQAFLHRARALRGLAPHQVARIARRLEAPGSRRQGRGLRRALAAAALVLTAGTAVAWASGAFERLPGLGALFGRAKPLPHAAPMSPPAVTAPAPSTPSRPTTAPDSAGAPTASDGLSVPLAPASAGEVTGRARAMEPSSASHAKPHRRKTTVAAAPAATPADPSDNRIVLEGRSFANALQLWRARRDGLAAMAALDEHERRFPGGQMRAEALVLRAEILLAGQREREALAALDQVALDRVPRARELHTLRGELRARVGRCEDARADLAPVARGADAHAKRAQQGLARCP